MKSEKQKGAKAKGASTVPSTAAKNSDKVLKIPLTLGMSVYGLKNRITIMLLRRPLISGSKTFPFTVRLSTKRSLILRFLSERNYKGFYKI